MIIKRPINGESDCLKQIEVNSPLVVTDLDHNELLKLESPADGWTHESLESISDMLHSFNTGWNAYLGTTWVGSSEV
ncbi:hypothetical protein [Shewanella sp. JNE4-2]|uniref:hypothetical protein n=1 Tax=Shewanella sp. JNE4-2 TaxID=2983532 RepID=UPI002002F1BE|nr:hypothetical protein [Shewanella sp. JNE4-2]MCK7657715.1 hypothetical protein [Shewanella sp. JNE4-2]